MASKLLRACAALLLGLAFLTGTTLTGTGAPASASPVPQTAAVRTVTYDASQAAEFRSAVDEGARIWNEHVSNVRFVAGTPADVVVYADDGWPRAQPTGLGSGRVWMGRQAVQEGHYPVRIAAHELGHILGLPDRRTGLCTDLMSGASAGTSCHNPNPNPAEVAEVERNFQNGRGAVVPGVTITEAPALPR
ncbi:snapalysin family zinc-dependent metalloprotease [Actinomadura madurae]|uniref:snapalysin family zinc-dependent metalloprotease n=1 Tax=Actinomadura madurae TaxID=1993 RepID=UPI0020267A54|nr:snapalysin family zinc-dependent metalloprotease [Actinomadura madurae]URM95428.1 snapalysin family zinc-dependent metalloprotease [Actinomadura madurae]